MNVVQRNFLRLLSAGTFGTDDAIEAMSPFKWRQLFRLASLHDVTPMVFDGIERLKSQFHVSLPADLYEQWRKAVVEVERDNERKNEIITAVFSAMTAIRTCPVLINGQNLAQFYPAASHRAEGSVDLYIPDEKQAQQAADWMDEHSMSHDDTDSNVTRYVFDGIAVNFHWTMRHLTNPVLNRRLQSIINKEMRCRDSYYLTVNGMRIEGVPPTLNLLMIITGITQHILSDGISLKLFVDLGMFLRRIGDKVDYVQLQSQLKKLGMQSNQMFQVIRDRTDLNGKEKLETMFRESLNRSVQDDIFTVAPSFYNNPQLLFSLLHETIEISAPDYIQPIIEQGVADGSIVARHPKQLAELISLMANLWMNPMTFDDSVEETYCKFMVFDQVLKGLGLDIVDEEMLARMQELTAIYQKSK